MSNKTSPASSPNAIAELQTNTLTAAPSNPSHNPTAQAAPDQEAVAQMLVTGALKGLALAIVTTMALLAIWYDRL